MTAPQITLTLTGPTIQDLKAQMYDFLRETGYCPEQTELMLYPLEVAENNSPDPKMEVKLPALELTPETPETPKKRSRKVKVETTPDAVAVETVSEVVEVVEEPAPEPKAVKPPPTFDDVKKAVNTVLANHGIETAQSIVKMFGASKLSEISPDEYANVIQMCKKTKAPIGAT